MSDVRLGARRGARPARVGSRGPVDPLLLEGITGQAARALGSVAAVASVIDRRPFLRSEVGLPLSLRDAEETPVLDALVMVIAARRRPLAIADAAGETRAEAILRGLGFRACLATSLAVGRGRVPGALCVFSERPRDWDEAEVDLVRRLARVPAGGVAGPLASVSAESAFDRAAAGLNRAYIGADDPQRALDGALDSICRHLEWDLAGAWLPDGDGTELRCGGYRAAPSLAAEAFAEICRALSLEPGTDLLDAVLERGETIWRKQLPAAEFPQARVAEAAGIGCGAWVPLPLGAGSAGVLELLAAEPRRSHDRDAPRLIELGEQLGELISLRRVERATPGAPPRRRKRLRPFSGLPRPGSA